MGYGSLKKIYFTKRLLYSIDYKWHGINFYYKMFIAIAMHCLMLITLRMKKFKCHHVVNLDGFKQTSFVSPYKKHDFF